MRARWLVVDPVACACVVRAGDPRSRGGRERRRRPAPQPAAGQFVPLPAANVVDTTTDTGWSGQLQPGATNSVTVTGVAGVPASGVLAVMLHITTSGSSKPGVNSNGNVWAWPADAARPQYATVANAPAGSVADNTAIVQVSDAGQISFYDGSGGSAVDVQADIEGYVTSKDSTAVGAAFAPLTPSRIIDTSAGVGGRSTPLTSDAPWTVDVLGARRHPRPPVYRRSR